MNTHSCVLAALTGLVQHLQHLHLLYGLERGSDNRADAARLRGGDGLDLVHHRLDGRL